ncbi:MAG: hypothetical protein OEZ16_03795 [Chromatiales bacterium]|nr:hypothetical protein [Chromatiales bacterium]
MDDDWLFAMGKFEWYSIYVGAAYLLSTGVAFQAVVVWYARYVNSIGKVGSLVSDMVMLINLSVFFLVGTFSIGAVFAYGKIKGVHDIYVDVFAISLIAFLVCVVVILKLLSKKLKECGLGNHNAN